MISSIRLDGSTACMALEGGTTKEAYREYVRQILVPQLRSGDIVIFDNLSAYHDQKALDMIHAAGAMTLPLPAYSPDLNPWSKIKTFLQKVKARTLDTLIQAIGDALKTITQQDAVGWFKSCGYIASQT